jgi:hypothetical protein
LQAEAWMKSAFMLNLKTIFGGVLGALAALVLSYYGFIVCGNLFLGPESDQLIGVLMFVFGLPILVVSIGAGTILGQWMIEKNLKLFSVTVLPLATYLVCLIVLKNVVRPHQYSLVILGTPKANVVGFIDIDGRIQQVECEIPASYEFVGERIEYALALSDQTGKSEFRVEIVADGQRLGLRSLPTTTGEYQIFRISGYSAQRGDISGVWRRFTSEEAKQLLETGEVSHDLRSSLRGR